MKRECACAPNLSHLRELSLFVDDLANVRPDIRQPFIGATAFAHKGGMHVNAVEKIAHSYEHIQPELVGNHRRVLVSELSGRSNIMMKAHELGIDLTKDTTEIRDILQQLKQLEHAGYEFEAADASLNILIQKLLKKHKPFFSLLAYRVIMDRHGVGDHAVVEASVKIESTDGIDIWGTVGVHDNIIEASWEALVDSVEYKLFKDEKRK
jgi:2-isopropylmalate synthase